MFPLPDSDVSESFHNGQSRYQEWNHGELSSISYIHALHFYIVEAATSWRRQLENRDPHNRSSILRIMPSACPTVHHDLVIRFQAGDSLQDALSKLTARTPDVIIALGSIASDVIQRTAAELPQERNTEHRQMQAVDRNICDTLNAIAQTAEQISRSELDS